MNNSWHFFRSSGALLSVVLACAISACAPGNQAIKPSNNSANDFSETPQREQAMVHAQLGSAYFKHGQMAIAKDEFERSASIDPNFDAPMTGLGLVYSTLGMNDKAEASFKKAISINPGNSETHNNYGAFLCSIGKVKESIPEFKTALSNPLYQTPEMAWMNAGDCSVKMGDYKQADSFYSKIIDKDPFNWGAYLKVGGIKYQAGEYKKAYDISNILVKNVDPATPEILAFSIKAADAVGDKDASASYEMLLINQFPSSREAKSIMVGKRSQ